MRSNFPVVALTIRAFERSFVSYVLLKILVNTSVASHPIALTTDLCTARRITPTSPHPKKSILVLVILVLVIGFEAIWRPHPRDFLPRSDLSTLKAGWVYIIHRIIRHVGIEINSPVKPKLVFGHEPSDRLI